MKKVLALVMVLVLLVGCTACGKKEEKSKLDQIKEAGKLVVGTSADYPPFEFHTEIDGVDTIVGIDIDICKYIAEDLGVELEIVDMNFDNLVMSLKQGEFDIVAACMSADEKRLQSIDFTDVVYYTDTVMITKKDVAANFAEPEDLEGHKVGAQSGSKPYDKAAEYAGEENVVGLTKLQDLILEVQNDKIEGALMDELAAKAYASANPELEVCPFRFERTEYSGIRIGVQKGDEEFTEYLNTVIAQLIEEDLISGYTLEAQKLAGME
jgi:ABC-type amino acid transport substrate-binding protein